MLILSYGMPKSASTFIYSLLRDILTANGHDQNELSNKLCPSKQKPFQTIESIDDVLYFDKKIPKESLYLIKTILR